VPIEWTVYRAARAANSVGLSLLRDINQGAPDRRRLRAGITTAIVKLSLLSRGEAVAACP